MQLTVAVVIFSNINNHQSNNQTFLSIGDFGENHLQQ